jgi:nucleoside-diphosphate-sugar epimerase
VKAASICRLPLYIPQTLEGKNISLVYVSDVADAITNIVTNSANSQHLANNAFNLAFKETPTLQGLLLKVSSRIQGTSYCCKIIFTTNTEVPHIYPSVENGPINISKSQSLLNWDPTPLDEAVDKSVIFYESLEIQPGYENSKRDMFETLCEDLSDLYSEVEFAQLKKELKEILSIE